MAFKYLLLMKILISSSHVFTREFRSRRWHQSTIAGNWLYIDGGDIAYSDNTTAGYGKYDRENNTYGLDLSKDWTNSSLEMIQTQRPSDSTALNGEALWYDSKRNAIYCFGGQRSYATPALASLEPPPDSIWEFNITGNGSGVWQEVIGPDSKPFPSEIHRVAFGAFASNDSTAYYLSGYGSSETSPALQQDRLRFPGLLMFDFDTLTITNSSDDGYFPFHPGAMMDIPTYGDNGVLVIFPEDLSNQDTGFDNITLYDKKSNTKYSQLASGDIPEVRRSFCAVGIQGDEPPYFEIFMHGGVIDNVFGPQTQNSDQVYVLSLPSFRWFRANYTPVYSRARHTCQATASGQMIMIGGVDPRYLGPDFGDIQDQAPLDPWPQGVGVFDMTALRFKDSYQAKAEAYKTPDVIKNYHSIDGNKYPSSWTSTAVKELFEGKSNTSSDGTNVTTTNLTAPSSTAANSTAQSSSTTTPVSTSSSRLSHGAVASIAVGCTAAFVLSACGAFFMVKHRSTRIRAIDAPNDTVPIYSSKPPLGEFPAEQQTIQILYQHRTELPGRDGGYGVEIASSEPIIPELPSGNDRR